MALCSVDESMECLLLVAFIPGDAYIVYAGHVLLAMSVMDGQHCLHVVFQQDISVPLGEAFLVHFFCKSEHCSRFDSSLDAFLLNLCHSHTLVC